MFARRQKAVYVGQARESHDTRWLKRIYDTYAIAQILVSCQDVSAALGLGMRQQISESAPTNGSSNTGYSSNSQKW